MKCDLKSKVICVPCGLFFMGYMQIKRILKAISYFENNNIQIWQLGSQSIWIFLKGGNCIIAAAPLWYFT